MEKEVKPVEIKLAEKIENAESKPPEIAPAKPLLLSREAMKMVGKILGRLHPAEWAVLRNRLAGRINVAAEDETLMSAIDDLQAARKIRREAYEARPKCAKCGGVGRLGSHVNLEDGEIHPYHLQCAGDKKLTSRQNALRISESIKGQLKKTDEVLVNVLQGMLAASEVENKHRAEDKKDAHKTAEEKDKRRAERVLDKAAYQNKKRYVRKDEALANIATIVAAKEKK